MNAHEVNSTVVRHVWQQFSRLNFSVYSAALRGGRCTMSIVRFDVNPNNYYYPNYYYYYYYQKTPARVVERPSTIGGRYSGP